MYQCAAKMRPHAYQVKQITRSKLGRQDPHLNLSPAQQVALTGEDFLSTR